MIYIIILIVIISLIKFLVSIFKPSPPTEQDILVGIINGLSESIDRMNCLDSTKRELYGLLSTGIFNESGDYLGMFSDNPWIKERCYIIKLAFSLQSGNPPKESIGEILDRFEGHNKNKVRDIIMMHIK